MMNSSNETSKRKKPKTIVVLYALLGAFAIAILAVVYGYIQSNKKPFAMACLEKVLKDDGLWLSSDKGADPIFEKNEFAGVRRGELGYSFDDDCMSIPFIPVNALRNDGFFVSDRYYKRVANGILIGVCVERNLSATLSRAIWEEKDRNGLVKKALREILSLIGEPYRSNGYYWNGSEFVLGAVSREDEQGRDCAYITCNKYDVHGQRTASIEVCIGCSTRVWHFMGMSRVLNRNMARRHWRVQQDAETYEDSTCEKFPGIFSVGLGDRFQGEEPTVMNDGAIHVYAKVEADPFGFEKCSVFELPESHQVFRIFSAMGGFKCEADAFAFYDRIVDYYQTKYRRGLFDELGGEPQRSQTYADVIILRRETMRLEDKRRIKFECLKIGSDEISVSVSAIDDSLQGKLPDEVGSLLEQNKVRSMTER